MRLPSDAEAATTRAAAATADAAAAACGGRAGLPLRANSSSWSDAVDERGVSYALSLPLDLELVSNDGLEEA